MLKFFQSLLNNPSSNYGFIALEGQSNAYGVAPIAELPGDLNIVSRGNIFNLSTNNWELIQPNVNNGGMVGYVASSAFGIEMRLLKLAVAFYGIPQYLHKYTYFGTYLAQVTGGNPDWSASSTSELFDLSNINFALSKTKLPGIVPLKCLVWIQGENDTDSSASNYQTNLQNFIAAKRTVYGLPVLPFIIVRLGNLQTGLPSTGYNLVRSAQNTVALQVNNYLVDADGLATNSSDNIHYTSASYDTLANRVFNIIKTLP